ncbi:MAG: NAD(P)/FAD-dependent oxidoreductase [Dehalococcoidia bacterium]|nr:NAD(P)/FAD-dependent oxidoreductase [Dehalococcoidia bacterium]
MNRATTYLLIGGGLAAYHAAKQIRRTDSEGRILLVGDEPDLPYDRPPLSKEFLRGEKDRGDILFDEPKIWSDSLRVDLVLGTAVTGLEPNAHKAILANGDSIDFDKALLATGGRPVSLTIPGSDLAGIHYLRTATDASAIRNEATKGSRAVVVGAGFIGLEVAASLVSIGLKVTVIEAAAHVWPRFADASLAAYIKDYCHERGVEFITGDPVMEFRGEGRVTAVVTQHGQVAECDMVIVGIGIRPNVELAASAELQIDNGVVVDHELRTSHPDIYAAGDVINYPDSIFEKRRRVEHWGHAEYTGQIAGRNMAGGKDRYNFLSYVWSDIFDLHLEFAGDEEEHDQVIRRASNAVDKFAVLYLKKGYLTAYFAVNLEPRDFSVFRRLILAKRNLHGHESDLANVDFPVAALLN